MSTTQRLTRHRSRALLLGVSAAVALATAACGSSSSGSGGSSSSAPAGGATSSATSSAGTSSQFAADIAKFSGPETNYPSIPTISGGVKSLAGKTVWYIPIGDSVPILATFGTGVQQALAAAGLKYHLCDGKFLPTDIASCLQQAQTQGASAVITGYIDYALLPSAYQNLTSHHIPVLVAGEDPDGGVTSSTASLAFDAGDTALDQLQRLQMESIITDSGGKAKIIYLGVTDSPSTKAGAAYGKQFIETNCPGCTIDEVDYNTAEISKVPSQVASALTAHPDTTYVVDELDAAGEGTYSGIQTAGFTNKVKMSGTNGGLDSLQRIKAGTVQTIDVGLSPIYTGWQYADGILRQMTGSVPNEGIGPERVFTSSNVGNLTLTPSAYASNAWYGDDSFENTFKTAWGVS